jgi:hypothetical protein
MRGDRCRGGRTCDGAGSRVGGARCNVPERAYTIGFETASRNSEVIHGGLYYPAGSLKARCCVAGRERLYPYCRDHGVPHVQIGKPIVAAEESEIAGLERVANTARANGVDELQWLTARQAQRSNRRCVALPPCSPLHRYHRQPCANACLSGRGRSGRRDGRTPRFGAFRPGSR